MEWKTRGNAPGGRGGEDTSRTPEDSSPFFGVVGSTDDHGAVSAGEASALDAAVMVARRAAMAACMHREQVKDT